MTKSDNPQAMQMPAPDPALKRLDKLVGSWRMKGRTLGSKEDNVFGENTFEWLPGGFFLQQTIKLNFMGFEIQSTEIIGYDPSTKAFASHVYSNMSGIALPYQWDVQGDTLMISVEEAGYAAKFKGTFSDNGNALSGGWRPEPGTENPGNVAYDLSGTRVK